MANTDMSFFGLNRPEYIPSPELALVELVWSLDPEKGQKTTLDSDLDGIAFGHRGNKPNKKMFLTKPEEGSDIFLELAKELGRILGKEKNSKEIAKILLSEIEIYASRNTTRSTAAPLNLHMALLQDRKGITGKRNPSNVALILEQIYKIGQGEDSAAYCLLDAYENNVGNGLPHWVDEVIPLILPEKSRNTVERIRTQSQSGILPKNSHRTPKWIQKFNMTPFHWFASSWRSLCTETWIDAMPRRRWTDWATCVTRTGVAASFLFEMHVNSRLVPALVDATEAREVINTIMEESNTLISWDEKKARSAQDIGPTINRLAAAGSACQEFLRGLHEEIADFPAPQHYDDDQDGLANWLIDARKAIAKNRDEVWREIAQALDAKPSASAKNIRETIRYSFLDRGGNQTVDLYSLLKPAGRYTYVDPGQEWLVAIASLCASGPKTPTRLARLNKALAQIGVSAGSSTLVEKLETFGLARSSHDADDAIEIQPAF